MLEPRELRRRNPQIWHGGLQNSTYTRGFQPEVVKGAMTSDAERDEMKKIPYREAVGSVTYASQDTRPDISHAVAVVSRFSNNQGKAH